MTKNTIFTLLIATAITLSVGCKKEAGQSSSETNMPTAEQSFGPQPQELKDSSNEIQPTEAPSLENSQGPEESETSAE